MSLLELFCHVDDFWRQFSTYWQKQMLEHNGRRVRNPRLSVSEIILPRKDKLGKLSSIRGVDAHRAHPITGLLSAL